MCSLAFPGHFVHVLLLLCPCQNLQALQYVQAHPDEVCPAGWKPGEWLGKPGFSGSVLPKQAPPERACSRRCQENENQQQHLSVIALCRPCRLGHHEARPGGQQGVLLCHLRRGRKPSSLGIAMPLDANAMHCSL